MDQYFGTYQEFETASKNEAAALLGADNLVGDIYEVDTEIDGDVHQAWLVNRFDKRVGYFNPSFSRKLSIMKAQGMTLKAILSFVAYTDQPEPGRYWGEMAVIGYNPSYGDVFEKFISAVSGKMAEGTRVRVDLRPDTINEIVAKGGSWLPTQTVPMPEKARGTAIMKSKRSVSEKMIEQGRKGNKGCYIISWLFLFVLAALVVFGLRSCGLF